MQKLTLFLLLAILSADLVVLPPREVLPATTQEVRHD